MEFREFKVKHQSHLKKFFKENENLFVVDVVPDNLWNLYLAAFPEGTNPVYKERTEYDCNCCKSYIRSFGLVVALVDNQIVTPWGFETGDNEKFQPVVDALDAFVKSTPIKDVFVTSETHFGTDKSRKMLEDGNVQSWEHFWTPIPSKFKNQSRKSEASVRGSLRDVRNVFQRSLEEISRESLEMVLELIDEKALYRGEEWKGVLNNFLSLRSEYHSLSNASDMDNYCWSKSLEVGGAVAKIKNHSIGVLLRNLTSGMGWDEAVRKYEKIVAPSNYKRPQAIFTKKMVAQAQETIVELGLEDSLPRRFALLTDITINNILFANRDIAHLTSDVFDELMGDVLVQPKSFDKIQSLPVEKFIQEIVSKSSDIEVLFENHHASNLFSLVAPEHLDSKTMFKWDNNFSWAYNGNVADSMKERVKAAGGKVDGVLRFSIQWNDHEQNLNDYDAHCKEPSGGNHIFFQNKGRVHPSSGMLDVDIVSPARGRAAVENITWSNLAKMKEGTYKLYVHNYSHNGGTSGFDAEVEYDGKIYQYSYHKNLRQGENVVVAEIKFSKTSGIEFVKSLPSTESSKTVWNISTNKFHPVDVLMFSPNYWDEQEGIGNKHYFFSLKGCKNPDTPNGFFNEYLDEKFMEHKKVFAALGKKMKVSPSERQISGVGFSSTKRNSLICKVTTKESVRTYKVIF